MTISGEREGTTSGAPPERTRAVDAGILAIEKSFGRGSIMRLGSAEHQAVKTAFDTVGITSGVVPTDDFALYSRWR